MPRDSAQENARPSCERNIRTAQDRSDGANTVSPADFLSFLIRAPGVTDGNFKDARPAFRELDGKFRFDLEPLADQGDALEQGHPNHLVTGFHVS